MSMLLLFVIACSTSWAMIDDDGSCNYTWYSKIDGQCKCGSELGGCLRCIDYNKTVEITAGYCMTYDPMGQFSGSSLVVGGCPFAALSTKTGRRYNRLPTDPTLVNTTQCSPYNRKGLFCGECIEGFGPAVYSFDLHCANCSHFSTATAITLYITLECVPITVFYLVVLIVRPTLFNGPQFGYIIFCQYIYICLIFNHIMYNTIPNILHQSLVTLHKISILLSGILNLKFFRFIMPSFCISEQLSGIQVHMLGFISSILPMCLVVATYIIVELKSWNKYKPRLVNIRRPIVHALATFTVLSISSTTCQVYIILVRRYLIDHTNRIIGSVYAQDTVSNVHSHHYVLYVIISILLLFILAVIPGVLLCIYPTRVYRRLSQCLNPRRQLAMMIFVEAVNSGFKDGLNGTRDYRMIPGAMMLLVITFFTPFAFLPYSDLQEYPSLVIGLILLLISFITSHVKPCKDFLTNVSLSFHVLWMGILNILIFFWWLELIKSKLLTSAIVLVMIFPHVLMLVWVLYCCRKILNNYRLMNLIQKFRQCVHGLAGEQAQLRETAFGHGIHTENQPLIH